MGMFCCLLALAGLIPKVTLYCPLLIDHPLKDQQKGMLALRKFSATFSALVWLGGPVGGRGWCPGAGEWSRFDSGRCYYDPGAGLRLTGSPPAALDTATAILSLHPRTAIPGCYTALLYRAACWHRAHRLYLLQCT